MPLLLMCACLEMGNVYKYNCPKITTTVTKYTEMLYLVFFFLESYNSYNYTECSAHVWVFIVFCQQPSMHV